MIVRILITTVGTPKGTQNHEANAEIETQPVTVEAKINKCST